MELLAHGDVFPYHLVVMAVVVMGAYAPVFQVALRLIVALISFVFDRMRSR